MYNIQNTNKLNYLSVEICVMQLILNESPETP